MDWIWDISKWSCAGVFGLMAFGGIMTVAFALGDQIRHRRRRQAFFKHEVFRSIENGETKILEPVLESRLNAIGSFTTTAWGGGRDIVWQSPRDIACDFAPIELAFRIDPDNIGPDEQTFQLWEKYQSQHLSHIATFKARLIELHREFEPHVSQEETLSAIQKITIEVSQEGYGESGAHGLRADFRPEWDEEHGYVLPFDPETNTFGDWEE